MASSASDRPALPRVGLPAGVEHARWGVWDRPAALLPSSYVAAVACAGGLPVLLPPVPPGALTAPGAWATAIARTLDGLDALEAAGQGR